jgi:hypothetical protein
MFKKVLFAAALLAQLSLFADASQGEDLERKMWQDLKDKKWSEVEKRLAPYFQAVQVDGARDREQYLNRVKALDMGDFTFNNFKVTEGPGVMVVTYDVTVPETIEGKRIISNAVRLSVWHNNNGNWQWIAHSILIPPTVAGQ